MPPAAINTGVDRSRHEGQSTPPPHHHHRHEPRQLALGGREQDGGTAGATHGAGASSWQKQKFPFNSQKPFISK